MLHSQEEQNLVPSTRGMRNSRIYEIRTGLTCRASSDTKHVWDGFSHELHHIKPADIKTSSHKNPTYDITDLLIAKLSLLIKLKLLSFS